MVRTKSSRGLIAFFVICSTAGAFAGWSAYSTQSPGAAPQGAYFEPVTSPEPLLSNKQAKGDRLVPARMVLASADPSVTIVPVSRAVEAAPVSGVAEPVAVSAVPLPLSKPKAPPASAHPGQPAHVANGAMDESQIAVIKSRLRLTPSQIQYWPAVEAALRDVLRQQAREARRTGAQRTAANIDVNSPEVQRLTWAAMPLLMQLREDQKHEVRKFARTIGLDQVASQI